MSGLIDNPQLTFDDLPSVETHKEEFEKDFGKDKSPPKTPKVIGKSKAEEWVKSLKEKQRAESKVKGQVKLTGGASTAHRLTEFETPETTEPVPDEVKSLAYAESLGEQAFKKGIAAPVHDKEFMKLFMPEGTQVGTSTPYLEAWNKGWTKANLKDYPDLQARPVHTEPTEPKSAAAVPVKSEVDVLIEKIMERVRAARTVKEAADINQELNKLSFKHDIPIEKMQKVYAFIEATIERLYKEKELNESLEKAMGETKKEEPKQDIAVTLLNRIKAAKTHDELQAVGKDLTPFLYSLPSVTGLRSETDVGMVISKAYSERMRELTAVQPITPEEQAKMHSWGYKELDAFRFYRDQEIKKYQKNIDYVKRQKKDIDELTAKLDKDPENKELRWNWRQMRKATETNLERMPYWEKAIERYNEPDWIEKNKDSYRERYVKEVKQAISKGKPVPAEVIAQHHEFRKARDNRERYEKGWKTSFANVSAAVVEGTKETAGVKVKRQDGKPITKQQIEEIVSGLKDIQDVIGNIIPVMKTENITVAHTSGKYPFLSQAGGMYHPTEKSVTMGIAGTNATAHEIAHFVDDIAKSQIPQTEPKYDLKLIGEASARINNYYGVDRMLSLSPKKTKEEKEAARLLRAHLGSYWRRQEEIFARLIEQYIAFKNQKSSTAYNSLKFYESTPGWWTHEDFLHLLPMVEAELKRKLELANKKHGVTQLIKNPLNKKAIVPILLNPTEINWKIPKLTKGEEIVWMSPREFLSKVPHPAMPAHLRIPAVMGLDEKYFDSYSLKSIGERIEKGWELDTPYIDYTHDAFGWAAHEGRHRALVALKMGIDKIPVLVIGKPLIKNPGDIIGDKPNPIMKQQLLKLWKQLLGAEDLGDFETFMKEVADLTYHEAKEKLIKKYGSPKGKEAEKSAKGEAQACDYAMEQCNQGEIEACTVACDECGIKEACEKKKVEPVDTGITDIDMTGLIEDKGERTSRLRIASGALAGKTAFRCPECFRGLTLSDKGKLMCGEHGEVSLMHQTQHGRYTMDKAIDLRQIGKDKEVTKRAKENYAWFLEEAREAGFKTVKEYYDSLKDKERDSYKEYARLGVGLEEIFSEKKKQPAKSDYQILTEWLDKADLDTPEGIEKYKSNWQNTYKEIYDRLPKPEQDQIFMRLTGDTQYIYDKKKEAEVEKMKETEFIPNAGLINKQLAERSHSGTSFDPEKRAEQEISGFVESVQDVYDKLKQYAKTDAQKALLIEEMQTFQKGYAGKYNEKLAAHGRTISSFITGGSNFPTRRAEKANTAYDKKFQEMLDWKDRAQKAIIRKLRGEAIEEAGGEIPLLQKKLQDHEKLQEMMVEANKIIRKQHEPGIEGVSKHQQLVNLGFSEKRASELLISDFAGRVGFTYHLANNSAEVRRLKERIAQLQRKEVTQTREFTFTGGNILDNQEDDRVQIFFDQKPAQDIISKLKGEGWHWSPSIGAWQRKRTEYALMSANRITGAQAETQFAKPEKTTGTEDWFDKGVEKIQLWSESGTMMGLISKEEAINLVKSGRYKIVNGVAVTELPHLQSEKAIPLEEAEEKIKKSLAAPEEKKIDVQWIFDKYTDGFNEKSMRAVTLVSDKALATGIRQVAPDLSEEEALSIAPQLKELAMKKVKVKPEPRPEIETMEEYRKRKAKIWDEIKDEPIRDVKVEIIPNRDKGKGREYPHVYVITTAVTDKGEIKLDETIYKGTDVRSVMKSGVEGFRQGSQAEYVGKRLSDKIDLHYFTEYSDLEPKAGKPAEPEKPKDAELKPQIPLYYIDIDLPTGLVRLFGILHKSRIFGEKSAFSLTGVYDAKGWQPLSERDYNVYKQSIGGSGKQALRGKTIQWFEKNSDAIIKAGEEELAKQEKSEKLYKDVQEAIKKAEKEYQLKASSLKVGDVLEWQVDKSRWVITEVKDGVVYARPESEPARAGGSVGGDAREGIVKGYKLVSQAKQEAKKEKEDEYQAFGTKVLVKAGDDPELEPAFKGTIIRTLNDGKIIEVRPEGQKEGSFRIPAERVIKDEGGLAVAVKPEVKKEPEYKKPEYTLEQWTVLYAPHLDEKWSWQYMVKSFSSWWQKPFKSFNELKEFLKKGESELYVHGIRGDAIVKWTPKTLTEPRLIAETGKSRVKGDMVYSLTQPYFNSQDNKWVWRGSKGELKTGESHPDDFDEAELLNAKEFTEAERIEARIERELAKYRMIDYSKAEIGTVYFVPDLVRDLMQDAQKLPKEKSDKYLGILEEMRTKAIAEKERREKAEKEKEKEKPVVKPAEPVHTERIIPKKLYRYYYRNRPPGIGTQPEGLINHESWLPARTTPHGRTAFGWVEYDRPLTPGEISGYELFEDEVELPKLVREIVQFAKDEGIDEAMKEVTSEYGRAVWEWLKSQKRIRAGAGQKEQIRDEIIRLAGITAPKLEAKQAVPPAKTAAQKEAEKILGIGMDKYDAYEWGTRVKLIEKQAPKGDLKDARATVHLSEDEYSKVKPFLKGVEEARHPEKATAHFVTKPDKFFISVFDPGKGTHSFEEAEGKPVTIKGFEGHDLFLHRTHGASGYSITEGRSGSSIVRGIKTEKEAMQEAEKVLSGFKRTINKKIAEAVKAAGLSPRYTAVELKRRFEKPVEKPSEKPEPKVEKAVEKAVETVKPEPKPELKPEPKPEIRVEPVHTEPKKPAKAKKSVKKFAEKFIKTEYGRAIVKKAKAGVIKLTSDDLKADVIILRE